MWIFWIFPEKRVGVRSTRIVISLLYAMHGGYVHCVVCTFIDIFVFWLSLIPHQCTIPHIHTHTHEYYASLGICIRLTEKNGWKKANTKLRSNDLKMMNYNRIVMTTKFIRNGWHEREKMATIVLAPFRIKFIKSHLNRTFPKFQHISFRLERK